MSRARFLCLDCGIDTGRAREFYALRDDVWLSVAPRIGMLCVGCVEIRLGRRLTSDDFANAYLNSLSFGEKSIRLTERLAA